MPGVTSEMSLVQVNGIEFHVEDRGNGAPVVLLHGFTGSSASWFSISDELAWRHRVIALDLIGHGASYVSSDPKRYAFDRALDDLAEVSNQLGAARATWLGYSMGGRLALGFALRHPNRVSSLILESATPGIQDDAERQQRLAADVTLARRIEDAGTEVFVAEWERLPMWESQRALPELVRERQRELRLGNSAIGLANSLRGMGQGAQPSFWDRLGELDMPVLLIAGALDRKFAGIAGKMSVKIPHATVSIVANTGHAVHLEQPRDFARDVLAFLQRRESPGANDRQRGDRWT